jgi:MATE family multidrug resistance protein
MAYGAQELTIFGELLKAGLAMTLLACVPLGALLAGGGDLLELAGLDPDLTGLAGDYILRLLPGILPHFTFLCLTKYLQCQHILAPSVWIGVAANIVNVGLNYVFIFTLGLGFNGAPIATTLSRCCQLLMLLAYLYFNNQHKGTWPRWFGLPRMDLAKELLHLAIPGFFMLGLETWVNIHSLIYKHICVHLFFFEARTHT